MRGDLVSHIRRSDETDEADDYRFSIFRYGENQQVTQDFRASDIRDFVKLCQVLAFAISDDGWLPDGPQEALLALFEDLDELTQAWGETNDG